MFVASRVSALLVGTERVPTVFDCGWKGIGNGEQRGQGRELFEQVLQLAGS
jgi:hypothetical protein